MTYWEERNQPGRDAVSRRPEESRDPLAVRDVIGSASVAVLLALVAYGLVVSA